jgi:hypothetical protein
MGAAMREVPFEQLVPERLCDARDEDDGRVTVLIPRFTGRLTRRWIAPLLRRPHVRLHLDQTGSVVWRQCDGRATVADIAARVRAQLGGDATDAHRRVELFLRRLAKADAIHFLAPAGAVRGRSS